MSGVTSGADLLGGFLDENGLSLQDAADALSCSKVAVWHWRTGKQRPRPEIRDRIASWTSGVVPADSWLTEDEREKSTVTPFVPAGVAEPASVTPVAAEPAAPAEGAA